MTDVIDALVSIADLDDETALRQARAALDAAGIESAVTPAGEILVPAPHAAAAQHVLRGLVDDAIAAQPSTDVLPPEPETCPACGTTNIRRIHRFPFVAIGIVFVIAFDVIANQTLTEVTGIGIGVILIGALFVDRWRCSECAHLWK
jgi:hypothetical protein